MKRLGLIIAIVVLGILSLWLGYYFYKNNTRSPIVYETTQPSRMDIIKKTVATGSIVPRKEVYIKPQVSGIIDELYTEPGLMVKKGDKLARIRLVPSPVNINNAESSVQLAQIRYEESKRELTRQRQVFSKQMDVEQARINYEDAQREEQRQRQLYEDGIIAQQEYNQYVVSLNLRKSQLENAEIQSENSLKQFETEVDIRKQELEAAINNLQLLREGASQNSGQVSNIVRSTVDGMILDIPVEEGSSVIERNNFNEGTTIASVADMQSLVFVGKVDESDVGKLQEGMPLKLSVGAIEQQTFDATLEYIAPKGVTEDGTVKFEIKAAIKPTKGVFLRAGYSANADIILDQEVNVLAIKERDVLFQDDSTFVELSTGTQQFTMHPVELGLSDGIHIEIINGIDSTNQIKVIRNPTK